MRRFSKLALIAAAAAVSFPLGALADAVTAPALDAAGTAARLPSLAAPNAASTTTTTATTTASPPVTTGSVNPAGDVEQRMNDCMAIWDKGTHMTKAQWRRTCKTTLRSLD